MRTWYSCWVSTLGPESSEAALSQLTPRLLVRLARDLLVRRNHETVRATDGPGDGRRDLYSQHRRQPHLTQCKFHNDPMQSCTTREVEELPVGLVKLGYKQGLFVTNARIGAPAKRELLDNYPGLELEFLDGDELLAEVLGDSVLRMLWHDGEHLLAASSRTTFPVIVRLHRFDQPLSPSEYGSPAFDLLGRASRAFQEGAPDFTFELGASMTWTPESFSPYRTPDAPSFAEGGLEFLNTLTVTTTGEMTLVDAASIARSIARHLASTVSGDLGPNTVVVGRPAIAGAKPVLGGPSDASLDGGCSRCGGPGRYRVGTKLVHRLRRALDHGLRRTCDADADRSRIQS